MILIRFYRFIKQSEWEIFWIPAYEGLAIADIFEAWGDNQDFLRHLPPYKEALRIKKQFIVSLAAKVIG